MPACSKASKEKAQKCQPQVQGQSQAKPKPRHMPKQSDEIEMEASFCKCQCLVWSGIGQAAPLYQNSHKIAVRFQPGIEGGS